MKVNGSTGPVIANPGRPAASSAGFSVGVSGAGASASSTSVSPAAGVSSVSALMALQGVESATERRRRAMRRGGRLLDRLEDLKLALLSGDSHHSALQGLGQSMREERPEDDDSDLKALLDQIDLRAAVEIAKSEVRRTAA